MIRNALLIPGTLCDGGVFDEVVDRLPDWRFAVVDLTGQASVEDAAAAAFARAPDRFVAVGFSLGGFVALEMLARAPDRVAAVVLVAANAHPDHPENAVRRRADVALSRDIGMAAFVDARADAWGIAARPAVRRRVAAMAAWLGPEVHARQAEMNITRPDLRAVAAAAPVPVLVVAGADDPLCPADRYAAAAAGPLATLVTLPGAGHYLPLEAPDVVAEAIARMGATA